MIMPPATAAGAPLTAGYASRTPQLEPPWAPCHVHCDGISFRLEKVLSDAAPADAAAGNDARPAREEAPVAAGLRALGEAELVQAAARGAGAVLGRAGAIMLSVRGATVEHGPSRIAADTAGAARRICIQAGKIAKRSVEHVGRIATLPWRLTGGARETSDGGEPRSRGI